MCAKPLSNETSSVPFNARVTGNDDCRSFHPLRRSRKDPLIIARPFVVRVPGLSPGERLRRFNGDSSADGAGAGERGAVLHDGTAGEGAVDCERAAGDGRAAAIRVGTSESHVTGAGFCEAAGTADRTPANVVELLLPPAVRPSRKRDVAAGGAAAG